MEDAIIGLTGGLDSTVLAHYMKDKYKLHGVFIYYGYPPQKAEKKIVEDLSIELNMELKIIDFSSYLRSFNLPPAYSIQYLIKHQFLIETLAMLSAYPDIKIIILAYLKGEASNQLEFMRKALDMLGVSLIIPFNNLDKNEVIKLGYKLGIDLSKSWSCIVSGEIHCGFCNPCRSRKRAFKKAGVPDPTKYFFNQDSDDIEKEIRSIPREEFYSKYVKKLMDITKEYSESELKRIFEFEK